MQTIFTIKTWQMCGHEQKILTIVNPNLNVHEEPSACKKQPTISAFNILLNCEYAYMFQRNYTIIPNLVIQIFILRRRALTFRLLNRLASKFTMS